MDSFCVATYAQRHEAVHGPQNKDTRVLDCGLRRPVNSVIKSHSYALGRMEELSISGRDVKEMSYSAFMEFGPCPCSMLEH
jgi:hypothetical protein